MKTLFISAFLLASLSFCRSSTTIDFVTNNAYGANIGWLNWYGDGANGAVIGEYVCSGYIYAANVGWINLGSGAPTNGIYYQNNSANDFGVNQDGLGNLAGYAWGANIGWINFEQTNGKPKINLLTGQFSGYVWSANCGWISLSNAIAYVQTDGIASGADFDDNGLPDAWEIQQFGHIGVDPNADPDHDGRSNLQEYLAGTDPNNGSDYLRITAYSTVPGGIQSTATWTSVSIRLYRVEKTPALASPSWADCGLGLVTPDGASTTRNFSDSNAPVRFYRVEAVRPLSP